MHEKYKERGVVFLGFTTHKLKRAYHFLQEYGVTWPNAYGVGALRYSAPVIYVLDTDGRMIWNDNRARYRHQGADLIQGLEDALNRELSKIDHG